MNSTTANLVKAPARRVDRSLFSIKLMLPAILAVLIIHSDTRTVVVSALADAYYQVSVFVAATLYLYHQLSKRFNQIELGYLALQNPTLEIVVAAILGILPGCGGAIVVVTQYTKNQASFGAVVAVLVATMGDAAFLLLAQQPLTAFSIMTIGLITGVLSGFVANKVLPTQQYRTSLEIDFPLARLNTTVLAIHCRSILAVDALPCSCNRVAQRTKLGIWGVQTLY
ncbi:putative manganese transporter [Pseudoalteromonas xiamenensis]|uniref:Arsenic efflux protein n=1 Tax=Pseudoalteromonas xiamenensis TaxID=882626 RepID=A0A975DGP6_9GAMM|nr:putative manganese transporter [Pseudoalteromonas xiamenensis]QTH71536.1 arsenic efflux protein [Pseudoalteromonas xiamenensis]